VREGNAVQATETAPLRPGILNQLVHRCVLIQSLYETSFAPALCLLQEHVRILDLMEQGQVSAAQREMAEHLSHIEASLNYDAGAKTDDRLEAALDWCRKPPTRTSVDSLPCKVHE
jgi:DNA-binding GntR family transcriptional regulator